MFCDLYIVLSEVASKTPFAHCNLFSVLCVCVLSGLGFADRYNTALVCHRWRYLACHPRLWLRVDPFVKDLSLPGVFHSIESAVSAARFVMYTSLVLVDD